jgi:hypothetical protein
MFQIIEVGSKTFFEALEKDPYEYSEMVRSNLIKWSNVNREMFLHGIFELFRLKYEDVPYIFSNVKKATQGNMARCPAHDDRQTSLSFLEADYGRILIRALQGVRRRTSSMLLPFRTFTPFFVRSL